MYAVEVVCSGSVQDPVRTNKIPRQIPEQAWYMHPVFSTLIGGILPFGAVFIELFFILTSMWLQQVHLLAPKPPIQISIYPPPPGSPPGCKLCPCPRQLWQCCVCIADAWVAVVMIAWGIPLYPQCAALH